MQYITAALAFSTAASAFAIPGLSNIPALVAKVNDDLQKDCHCDVSNLSQPPSALPPADKGTKLVLVTIARGTQNYTCPTTPSASAVPTAIGAVANLYDFSCVAARTTPDQLANITAGFETLPRNSPIIASFPPVAKHFFSDPTTPNFDVANSLGSAQFKKANQTNAPASDKNAVAWLKLVAIPGQSSPLQNVFRLETANGGAPATCGKITGAFQVEYAAEYWFYAQNSFSW